MTTSELRRELDQAKALSELWESVIQTFTPDTHQFILWLRWFGFDVMRSSIERTSTKLRAMNGAMDSVYLLKYCTSVARQRYADANQVSA